MINPSVFLVLLSLTLSGLAACEDDPGAPGPVYPSLLARPEHRALALARLDREPWASIHAAVQATADRAYEDDDPAVWNSGVNGRNAQVAQAAALLAWLHDDPTAAAKASEYFDRLLTHWETNDVWDINIRMPQPLVGAVNARDLLLGTPYFSAAQAAGAADKIAEITGKFFETYVADDVMLQLLMGVTQNNHPIRTAVAIGYVAMALPDRPEAPVWASWAFSELAYLWGADGRYVQPDGGVSEEPFYYGFAFAPTVAFAIAYRNHFAALQTFPTDCRNRQENPPWNVLDCVDGAPFVFPDLLASPGFHAAAEWSLAMRLPSGSRPPLGDGYFNAFNGGALLSSFGGGPHFRWDWETVLDRPREMGHGLDLTGYHLIHLADVEPAEPPFRNRHFPDTGSVVLRSDWTLDARWLVLLGEAGAARKTVHDHVDGLSFQLAAYGEYLILDPGYYKPDEMDNAVTAQAPSHNVILVDGKGAPNKRLLTSFGDTDAWIRHVHDGTAIAYAESHQTYEDTAFERAVALVDGRYVVVADHLTTERSEARAHTFRLHGWAGYGSGGTFAVAADGATWERTTAGVVAHVASTAPALVVGEPAFVDLAAPHVHEFDHDRTVTTHGVMDATAVAVAPGFLTVLVPYRVGAPDGEGEGRLDVDALDLGPGVVAWNVSNGDVNDLVILREASAATTLTLPLDIPLETDARLVILRYAGPGPLALIARGTFLSLGGTVILAGGAPEGITVMAD